MGLAAEMSERTVRILVVDDTITYRKILSDAAARLPGVEIAGTAAGGRFALRKLETLDVDLVLLDVFMPEMDGVETLRQVRRRWPGLPVVMVSGATSGDADITLKALEDGALDFIPKPNGGGMEECMRLLTGDLQRVLRLVRAREAPRLEKAGTAVRAALPELAKDRVPVAVPPPRRLPVGKHRLVLIGVSTGGPNALASLIPKLPAAFPVPILIVQHMPPRFTASLAQHLDEASPLRVREASECALVRPGEVLIAPGGRHMTVARQPGGGLAIRLKDGPPVNSCRPAVDVLFNSVAEVFDEAALAVILTGMGEDGAAGVARLKQGRCHALVQDEASCVVYGMPRAVVERGLADEALGLEELAARIRELV